MKRMYPYLIITGMLLAGCTQIVTAPISIAGSAVGATLEVAGSAVGATVNAVSSDDDEKSE